MSTMLLSRILKQDKDNEGNPIFWLEAEMKVSAHERITLSKHLDPMSLQIHVEDAQADLEFRVLQKVRS